MYRTCSTTSAAAAAAVLLIFEPFLETTAHVLILFATMKKIPALLVGWHFKQRSALLSAD